MKATVNLEFTTEELEKFATNVAVKTVVQMFDKLDLKDVQKSVESIFQSFIAGSASRAQTGPTPQGAPAERPEHCIRTAEAILCCECGTPALLSEGRGDRCRACGHKFCGPEPGAKP